MNPLASHLAELNLIPLLFCCISLLRSCLWQPHTFYLFIIISY